MAVIRGDARAIPLRDETVQCVVNRGRFKKGQHWRKPQPFWDRDWLLAEYVEKSRSSSEIAKQFGIGGTAIIFWLKKHGIPTRSTSEARAVKHWGASGASNPMFGKIGQANPNYRNGSSPERQRLYASGIGRETVKQTYRRDGYKCVRCAGGKGKRRGIHAHHIESWSDNPSRRFDLSNLVTLCRPCHSWVHSKANVGQEFIVRR